jgi:diguanylate cyclase (GGDEF)-like protein
MERQASPEQRRELRLSLALRQIPEVLIWAGVLTLVFGVVNVATLPGESPWSWATNLVFGPLFVLLGWALRRGSIRARHAPAVWASCSLLLVAMLAIVFHGQPNAANLAYLVAVMTAYGPITHAWAPFWVSGGAMLAVAAATFAATPGADPVDDTLVCVAALLIGSLLLRLRMRALDDLADSHVLLDHQATYDPLTDLLNRNGLERALPSLSATALRSGARLLVWFIDVRGLKQANDLHGHSFGDDVIRATADALRSCVRANDLTARWGGDEFVVLGQGAAGSAEDLDVRMNALLARDDRLASHGPRSVTVGFACGPGDSDVYELIAEADADMYRRRIAPFAGESS